MKKLQRLKSKKGFSLVELLIVIAIMAVLVGVLAPQYIRYVERSRMSADVQTVNTIASTIRMTTLDPMFDDILPTGDDAAIIATWATNTTTTGTLTITFDGTIDAADGTTLSNEILAQIGGSPIAARSNGAQAADVVITYSLNADGSGTISLTGVVGGSNFERMLRNVA